MFAAIFAIGMILGISLSTRIASSQPLREYFGSVETEIAGLEQEYVDLVAERDFALSDAYVEQWARSDGKMVRSGEVLVIPVPLGGQEEVTQAQQPLNFLESETVEPEPEPWERWWSLFFDSAPPDF
jgi:cell division protein FtsB